jgi:hypothetical protein
MISYSHQYLDIRAVCEHNELDVELVMQHLCDSDLSFGSNYDTLISQHHLQSIINEGFDNVQLDFGGHDDTVVISLGS